MSARSGAVQRRQPTDAAQEGHYMFAADDALQITDRCMKSFRFADIVTFQSLYGEQFANCGTKMGFHGRPLYYAISVPSWPNSTASSSLIHDYSCDTSLSKFLK